MTSRPISLYIHLPWCVKKCPYCDFNSHEAKDPDFQKYTQLLIRNLHHYVEHYGINAFQAVFFGGGTPSLFPPELIGEIINTLHQQHLIESHTEITLEANPGTLEEKNLQGFYQAGINRLSIGVQSFNDSHLQRIGRIHDSQAAKRIIGLATSLPFQAINIDIMYGLPDQTPEEALADLETAISFNTTHLSWYELTLEPNTLFYKYQPTLPADDLLSEMERCGHDFLHQHHYEQYEISAFARNRAYCQHNLTYWKYHDYLGIGAGAHSKLSLDNGIVRMMELKHPSIFLASKRPTFQSQNSVDWQNECFEFALNRFRLSAAIPTQEIQQLSPQAAERFMQISETALADGLLSRDANALKKSFLGSKFHNQLIGYYLP